ncbi:undecaprenyl-diphosphate phosphatase [Pseudomarimonas arenosa]|uniref:undecaprenyl-diphosphate phosphatase n=1 Tax=Pseudomarimonas arenosa TaxID=2774145 RepID=UPI001CDB9D50|nr:undecaprenyl-diphosphate phosphatase [Pseudomarimonas arenosa]
MNDLLAALLLGIIEGLTEFLPISSTGHLLIAQHWLGRRSDLFNIAVQSGAILAVSLVYRQRLWSLASGWREPEQRDYALKLIGAFAVTAVLGLIAKLAGVELPESVLPVAAALMLGGIAILWIEGRSEHFEALTRITWRVAIIVGAAQVIAGVFPGTSRSAAAIFAALLAGIGNRPAATEFAFLVGIPTMFAATGFEILRYFLNGGSGEAWADLGVAFVAATVTGFIAVRWLLGYVKSHRFTVFAWYRIALGLLLIGLLWDW